MQWWGVQLFYFNSKTVPTTTKSVRLAILTLRKAFNISPFKDNQKAYLAISLRWLCAHLLNKYFIYMQTARNLALYHHFTFLTHLLTYAQKEAFFLFFLY
jgi:hypothetical protein